MKKNKVIFLDRDGIINEDKSYVHKIEDFEFCSGIFETLKRFQELGYMLIIVTNQSGIGRGYYTQKDFDLLNNWMLNELKNEGIDITKVYYCPHDPNENCNCRKPNPGMLQYAKDKFNIDIKSSWMIGDKISDIEAANNLGIKNTILLKNHYFDANIKANAKYTVNKILDTITIIK